MQGKVEDTAILSYVKDDNSAICSAEHQTCSDICFVCYNTAINNRLKEELGFNCCCDIIDPANIGLLLHGSDVIYYCGKFQYYSQYEGLSENEIDNVFLFSPDHNGFSKRDFIINPKEVSEIKWIKIEELKKWLNNSPDDFSAWFRLAFELAYDVLCIQARDKEYVLYI